MTDLAAVDGLPATLRNRLHPAVRDRRIGDLTYLLGPDGVTCVALPDTDLAAATDGDPAILDELRRAGFTADAQPADTPRFRLTRDGIEFGGLDRVIERAVSLLRHTPRLPWGILGVTVAVGATTLGLSWRDLDKTSSVVRSALILILIEYVLLIVHELGHGVVLRWHGERIGRTGFGLHWGMPCFYVDASSALMLPRRARAWQAAAGVIAEGCLVAALASVALLADSMAWQIVAGQAAVLTIASVLTNLIPALDLDGSWLLADLIDRPELVTGTHRSGASWVRVYRYVNGVIGILFLAASALLWVTLWGDLLAPLWAAGPVGITLVVFTVLPMAAGLVTNIVVVLSRSREV